MIQDIIALIVVGIAAGITVYSLYKSLTTKEKGLCGGCPSCELKGELKKKGKLAGMQKEDMYSPGNLRFIAKK